MFPATLYKQFRFIVMLVASSFLLISCAETLPPGGSGGSTTYSETEYNSADELRGGRLYDKWWEVKNVSTPTGSNPIWSEIQAVVTTNSNSASQWRCKECHGWDYKGVNGAYSQGSSHFTGIRGFDTTNQAFTAEHVFKMISNGAVDYGSKTSITHKFTNSGMLRTADVYDLTKFIMEVARIDNASPTLGNAEQGKVVFSNIPNALDSSWTCATAGCHSKTATTAPTLDEIIQLSKDNPQEFLHKVRFGSPTGSMPFGMTVVQAQNVRAFVAAGAESVTAPDSNFVQGTYDGLDRDDVVNGGKLYDKWWKITTTATEPTSEHTRWPASNTAVTGSSTWRCKECHGWDYRGADGAYESGKHATGYRGIVNTSNFTMQYSTASDVYSFLREDTSHGFATLFTDTEYYALTKFIITMRSEVAASQSAVNFIDDQTLLAKNGDVNNGKDVYDNKNTTTCANAACHGPDGKAKDFKDDDPNVFPNEFVHNIAQENPWEFIHKVRFGDAGYLPMPTLYNADATISTINTAVDLLAYAQVNLVPNIKRAGLLYDKWWNVDGIKVPTNSATLARNAAWTGTADTTKVSDSSTWRCKECHGWDYRGVFGAYGYADLTPPSTGKHYSGIKGFVTDSSTTVPSRTTIIDKVTDGTAFGIADHDFGQFLSTVDIALIADFITDEIAGVPRTRLTYEAFLTDGNVTTGKTIYQGDSPGNCESCHGANGTTISTVDIKAIANGNPQEFFHKSRYGHPGSNMLPSSAGFAGLTLDEASDVLAYSKTITAGPGIPPTPGTYDYASADSVRGGRLYDTWWDEMKATDDTVLAPTVSNPYWDGRSANVPDLSAAKKTEASWRCKTCHAWDYKGIGYETGTPSDSGGDNLLYKINLRKTVTYPNDDVGLQEHLYNWIKTGLGTEHKYGGTATAAVPNPLGERDLWDLVKFLLEDGMIDSDSNILNSGIIIGYSNANGDGLFNGSVDNNVNCVTCHGADGTTPPPADQGGSGGALDIFGIAAAASDPWEYLHKVRFGQPGTSMPAIEGTNALTSKDAFDILGYSQQRFNSR